MEGWSTWGRELLVLTFGNNKRLDLALLLEASVMIISGGAPKSYGSSGKRPEAEAAAEYLKGKFGGKLLLETKAMHTLHNFSLTLNLLPPGCKHVTCVTHDWHTPRSKALADGVYGYCGITTDFVSVPSDASDRETAGRVAWERQLLQTWVPGVIAEWRKEQEETPWEW